MSTTTQQGEFVVGAVGLTLSIQLDASLDESFDFTGIESVALKIKRADGTEITAAPPNPAGDDITNHIINYVIQTGDLTVPGNYSFVLTINFGGDQKMVQVGSFTVGGVPTSALIKETGAIVEGANSYADVADGDQYHGNHLYPEAWDAADFDRKADALVMATRLIDAEWSFNGSRVSADQRLSWPRLYVPNAELKQVGVLWDGNPLHGLASYGASYYTTYYPSDSVPLRVVAATCEMARNLLTKDRTIEDPAKGIRGFSIGSGALSFDFDSSDRISLFTSEVESLLTPLGSTGSSSGFKTVVRT